MAGAPKQNATPGAEGAGSPVTSPSTKMSATSACANHPQTPVAAMPSLPDAFPDGRAAGASGGPAPAVGVSPPAAQNPGGEDEGNEDSDADSDASALPYAHTSASTEVSGFNDTLQPRETIGPQAPARGDAYDTDSDASYCRNCELDLDDPPGTKCGVCGRRRR